MSGRAGEDSNAWSSDDAPTTATGGLILPVADEDEFSLPSGDEYAAQRAQASSRQRQSSQAESLDAFSLLQPRQQRPVKPSFDYDEEFPPWRLAVRRGVVENPWFDRAILCVIVVNCAFMALETPAEDRTGAVDGASHIIDVACVGVFCLEVVLRIVAMGLYSAPPWEGSSCSDVLPHSGGYLRSWWNRSDLVITAVTTVTVFGSGSSLAGLRSFRLLRLVRAASFSASIRVLVNSLLASLPKLIDVFILYLFFIFVLAVVAVQLWKGLLRNRCVSRDVLSLLHNATGDDADSSFDVAALPSFDESPALFAAAQAGYTALSVFLRGQPASSLPAPYTVLFPPALRNEVCNLDMGDLGGFHCPWGFVCTEVGNPGLGFLSFDNVLVSSLSLFVAVTLEGWSSLMAMTLDATSDFTTVVTFFSFLVAFGSFFIINLTLVIISYAFEAQHEREKRQQAARNRAKRALELKTRALHEDGTLLVQAGATKTLQARLDRLRKRGTATVLTQGQPCEINKNGTWIQGVAGEIYIPSEHIALGSLRYGGAAGARDDEAEKPVIRVYCENGDVHTARRLKDVTPLPEGAARMRMRTVARSHWFRYTVAATIVLNTACLAIVHYPQSTALDSVLATSNYVFTGLFAVEMVLKVYGFGVAGYVHDAWNCFDAVIVVVSLVDIAVNQAESKATVLRAFRVMRLFKLANTWGVLRKWVSVMIRSLRATTVLAGIIALMTTAYAIVGKQFMGGKFCGMAEGCVPSLATDGSGDVDADADACPCNPRANFDNLGSAFLTMFQVLTGEDWQLVMYRGMRAHEDSGLEEFLVACFFVSFFFIGNYLLLNLFVAIMLHQSAIAEQEAFDAKQLRVASSSADAVGLNAAAGGGGGGGRETPSNLPRGGSIGGGGGMRKKSRRELAALRVASQGSFASDSVYYDEEMEVRADDGASRDDGTATPEFDAGPNNGHDADSDSPQAPAIPCYAAAARHASISVSVGQEELSRPRDRKKRYMKRSGSPLDRFARRSPSPPPSSAEALLVRSDGDGGCVGVDVDAAEKGVEGAAAETPDQSRALFLLGPSNPLRRCARTVAEHKRFEQLVVLLICVSTVFLLLEKPLLPPDDARNRVLKVANTVVTALFGAEMVLKVVAHGFILHKTSYLRREDALWWNLLDFVVVTSSFLSLAFPSLSILRVLRVLRPLRLIHRSPGMKVSVRALLASIPAMVNVFCITLLVWIMWAIMGVQLFAGKFCACTDVTWGDVGDTVYVAANRTYNLRYHKDCLDYPLAEYSWRSYHTNFDYVGSALLALFQMATLEGWVTVMHLGMDSVSNDEAPTRNNAPYMAIFFVLFIVLGSFCVMYLFISVLLDTYFVEDKKKKSVQLLTSGQKQWVHSYREMLRGASRPPQFFYEETSSSPVRACRRLIQKKRFEHFIMACIILNVVIVATEHFGQSHALQRFQEIADDVFILVFTLEAVVKIVACGRRGYFQQKWNRFDFAVVTLSWAGAIVLLAGVSSLGATASVFRIVRLARLLRLVKWAKGINLLLKTLFLALPSMFNVLGILALLFIVYGALGVRLFGRASRGGAITRNANFEYFPDAAALMIRMLTGEDWQTLLAAYRRDNPACDSHLGGCVNSTVAIAYFVTFIFTGMVWLHP